MSRLGEKIKNIRIDMGLSQKQLAKKLGVAESFVNEIELGRKVINESLMDRISKVLGKEINDIGMSIEEEVFSEDKSISNLKETVTQPIKTIKRNEGRPATPVNDVWSDALSSVLKTVFIYKFNLKDTVGNRQLPVISNKIDGFAQDKVLFLEIENNDMAGFRISKGDIAFVHLTHEIENNSICLLDYNGERSIRQIKRLDNNKILLISNNGMTRTETVNVKDINILARLDKLEIKL